MRPSVVLLVARELGLTLLKDTINYDEFEIKTVVTHYFENDGVTPRPLLPEFVSLCDKNSIPLVIVGKNQSNLRILKKLEFDFLIANCYKYLIPEEYLSLARIETLNMHRSLLPKYKGLKPLARALENGEKKTGTTIHKMAKEVDSGTIIDQYEIDIEEGDTVESLFEKLYPTQYPLMARVLKNLLEQNV